MRWFLRFWIPRLWFMHVWWLKLVWTWFMHVLGLVETNLEEIGSLQVLVRNLQNYAELELSRRAWGFRPRWARVFVVTNCVFLAHAEREQKCHAERAWFWPKCSGFWTRAERGVYLTPSVGVRWENLVFCSRWAWHKMSRRARVFCKPNLGFSRSRWAWSFKAAPSASLWRKIIT